MPTEARKPRFLGGLNAINNKRAGDELQANTDAKHGVGRYTIVGEYFNMHTHLDVLCNQCDQIWNVIPNSLKRNGCPKCNHQTTKSIASMQSKVDEIFGAGRYLLRMNTFTEYSKKMSVWCSVCDADFQKKPADMITRKRGCVICQSRSGSAIRKNGAKLQQRLDEVHNSAYSINESEYRGWKKKMPVTCRTCQTVYPMRPGSLLEGHRIDCECNPSQSKGEIEITEWLEANAIPCVPQWRDHTCIYRVRLIFDFYLPEQNMIIEFDGKQHFTPIEFYGGEKAFAELQEKDNLKDQWAKDNGIRMLRIPYYNQKRIPQILERET